MEKYKIIEITAKVQENFLNYKEPEEWSEIDTNTLLKTNSEIQRLLTLQVVKSKRNELQGKWEDKFSKKWS